MGTFAGTRNGTRLDTITSLCLGSSAPALLRRQRVTIHRGGIANRDTVLLIGLRNTHHRRIALRLRVLHRRSPVRHARL